MFLPLHMQWGRRPALPVLGRGETDAGWIPGDAPSSHNLTAAPESAPCVRRSARLEVMRCGTGVPAGSSEVPGEVPPPRRHCHRAESSTVLGSRWPCRAAQGAGTAPGPAQRLPEHSL